MPEKAPKANANPRARETGVLGALPTTRPNRLGTPRRGGERRAAAKPRAVRAAAPELKAQHASEPPPERLEPPRGKELVTTTIRATGELAHIGLVVGAQMLKRTIERLPRP